VSLVWSKSLLDSSANTDANCGKFSCWVSLETSGEAQAAIKTAPKQTGPLIMNLMIP
jgi:hypothetical protein